MSGPIYLDANATTPLHPEVAEAMLAASKDYTANPASQHALGRKARRKLEECREGILALLGAKTTGMTADTLLFTSGGTEANNLALLGIQSNWQKEHPSPQHPKIAPVWSSHALSTQAFCRSPSKSTPKRSATWQRFPVAK